jgi:hypothetical protein
LGQRTDQEATMLTTWRRLATLGLGGVVAVAACGDGSGSGGTGLQGTWRASAGDPGTYFVFEDEATGTMEVDLVADLGATVTLTIGAANVTLTVFVPALGTQVEQYTYTVSGDTITLDDGLNLVDFDHTLTGNTLYIESLTTGVITFDLDGDQNPDPAAIYAQFERH